MRDPTEPGNDPQGVGAGITSLGEIIDRLRDISRENERLFQRLAESEKRYRGLARAVWRVQEDERRRFARELHDGIGQTLTALLTQLERVPRRALAPDVAERLQVALELAGVALGDARELSRLLRPPVLDDLGLTAALRWLARTVRERMDLEVTLDCRIAEQRRFDPEIETLVFRVVQEALTNVAKHAGTRTAQVEAGEHTGALVLRVIDGGRGFELQAPQEGRADAAGSGLRGMRDRVGLFGGRFHVESRPGAGTVIEVSIPLSAAHGAAMEAP